MAIHAAGKAVFTPVMKRGLSPAAQLASSTHLYSVVPHWVQALGQAKTYNKESYYQALRVQFIYSVSVKNREWLLLLFTH